jgi:diguanylate cyclase (GGDEF)-like protein
MALILQRCVREEDTVARIGGDEFVLVLGGLSHERYAARVSEKILSELGQPVVCGDQQVTIGVSIGISIYPTDSDDLQMLLKEADDAMYRVKRSGKNHFEFFHGNESDGIPR